MARPAYDAEERQIIEANICAKAVELFAQNIMKAGEAFLDRPMERPFIPSWNRVISAVPDILTQLRDAVEADHADFEGG